MSLSKANHQTLEPLSFYQRSLYWVLSKGLPHLVFFFMNFALVHVFTAPELLPLTIPRWHWLIAYLISGFCLVFSSLINQAIAEMTYLRITTGELEEKVDKNEQTKRTYLFHYEGVIASYLFTYPVFLSIVVSRWNLMVDYPIRTSLINALYVGVISGCLTVTAAYWLFHKRHQELEAEREG